MIFALSALICQSKMQLTTAILRMKKHFKIYICLKMKKVILKEEKKL